MGSFLDLSYDVLFLICDQLELEEWFPVPSVARFEDHFRVSFLMGGLIRPLINLSETCRALRRLCAPRIFRFIYLNYTCPHGPWPLALSQTRSILLNGPALDSQDVPAFLSLATNLREVSFQCDVELLPQLLQSPGLDVLNISEARWELIQDTLPLENILAPLRVLRICVLDLPEELTGRQTNLTCEFELVEKLVSQTRSTLEVLVLPAGSIRTSLIAAAPWPQLRELALYGSCPAVDAPLLSIFDMLPNLCAFTLAAALERGRAPLVLWPRDSRESPDISGLRRFTLAPPSFDDDIFARLPPELEEISLRDMPRLYRFCRYPNFCAYLDAAYSACVLSCAEALSIFRSLRCCATLRRLELVVIEDAHELDLLAYIADACPRLAFFELHCYRDAHDELKLLHQPLAVSLDALGKALSAFSALRVVRLNIDTPWEQFTMTPYGSVAARDGVKYASVIAQTIAQAVPWLDAVCVLTRDGTHNWRMWSVQQRSGSVELVQLFTPKRDTVAHGQTMDI